jgi:hypothetical protein
MPWAGGTAGPLAHITRVKNPAALNPLAVGAFLKEEKREEKRRRRKGVIPILL